jgi:hypothetical protein
MKLVSLLAFLSIVIAGVACGGSDNKDSGAKPAAAAPTQAPGPTAVPTVAPPSLQQLAAAALAGAPGGSAQPRTNGVVQTVADGKVTLQDGNSFMLAPNARFARLVPIKASDLQRGQFVAITAKRQPDNTLLASVVSVFPPSLSSAIPGGERPLPEGNLMTNATIETISGNQFTVVFTGGGGKVTLAPDATLIKQEDASVADLKPGTRINAGVNNGVAASVYVP